MPTLFQSSRARIAREMTLFLTGNVEGFKDAGGDENFHLYAVDLKKGDLKDLTPFDGVRAELRAAE